MIKETRHLKTISIIQHQTIPLTCNSHMYPREGIHQPISQQTIPELSVPQLLSRAHGHQVGGLGHGLLAARHHQAGLAAADRLSPDTDRPVVERDGHC